ncbi:MAG: hypothetical protein HOV94_41970 [Saccharothrix sp.]|nr:hypothetical protein [Saccharothrix sp.]
MTTTTGAPATGRTAVGWGDLVWLTWRQHRWTVLGTAAAVGVAAALALGMALHVDASGDSHDLLGQWRYLDVGEALAWTTAPLGALIAVFWAAPLLAREYEQRTHLMVWSQDVTPLRWLVAKVVLLGIVAVALTAGFGTALVKMMNSFNAVSEYGPFLPFGNDAFEAAPQVQAGYAAFGFALGLAFSALTRRTVLSMGLTLVGFTAARIAVAAFWRPFFQEPLRRVEPYETLLATWRMLDGSWVVGGGYLDAAGHEIHPVVCMDLARNDDYARCMADSGIRYFTDYHPVERLGTFQAVEFAIFAGLAACLFAVTFTRVRRLRRV